MGGVKETCPVLESRHPLNAGTLAVWSFSDGGSYLDLESCLAVKGFCVSGGQESWPALSTVGRVLVCSLFCSSSNEAPAVCPGLQTYFTLVRFTPQ